MTIVLSYITDKYVAIAADKRTTHRSLTGEYYDDSTNKIVKTENFMYATSGHVDLIKIYEKELKAITFEELEKYSDVFFNTFEKSRQQNAYLKSTKKLQIHIATKNKLIVYMVFPNEDGVHKANVPINSRIPTFSVPNINDEEFNKIEKYIESNYPNNIEEAEMLSKEIIVRVSELDTTVCKEYDFEFFK